MSNPFTLVFGKSPLESVDRPKQIFEIMDAFTSENINQQMFVITGVRGTGKTVMMSEIAQKLRENINWIVLELNPATDLLQSMLSKLYSNNIISSFIKSAKIDLSFFGFGVSVEGTPQITDPETAIIKILEKIQSENKRLLICIDEMSNTEYMKIFAGSFQIFVRLGLPVFLLGAGLYENIDELQNEKTSMAVSIAGNIADNQKLFIFAKNIIDKFKENYNVIVSGRSLMQIYPELDYHFLITASLDERVKRKAMQYKNEVDLEELKNHIIKRDELQEKSGFYKVYPKTIKVDVTDCKNIEESTNKICEYIEETKILK